MVNKVPRAGSIWVDMLEGSGGGGGIRMRRGLDIYLDILATDGSLYRTVGRGD